VRKKKRKGGKGEADRWGRDVSESKEKKKERERRAAAGRLDGPAGLAGPKGEQGMVFFFLFFFSKLLFKTTFLFKFKSNSFSNFFSGIL
jgi:hypothetical protein